MFEPAQVRAGLQAKLSRAVYYELAELATPSAVGDRAIDAGNDKPAGDEDRGDESDGGEDSGDESNDKVDDNAAGDLLGVYSNGAFFPLGRA